MLVSVIIPTYNRGRWIADAVQSVLNQTCANFELIVVDDGSTDDTSGILENFSDKITIIRTQNRGVSSARNTGIHSSRGELLAFLDSDDYWLKHKIERQIAFFEKNPKMHICQTGEIWIRKGRRVNPKKKHQKLGGRIFEKSLELCIITASAVMMRRELLDEVGLFDEKMPACEDYDLWLRISAHYPVGLLEEDLVVKRGGHEDQLSRQWGLDKWRIYAMEKILKSGKLTKAQKKATLAELQKKCRIYADGCAKRKKINEADKYYQKIQNNL